jgi:putative ABC transport system ATP-binding protein
MTEGNGPAIRLDDVRKHYDGGRVKALDGVTLSIGAGETVAVVGPSGSGKTTLLNLVGALDVPSAGDVWIRGQKVAAGADLDRLRAKEIGFVFQLHQLIPVLTAAENVEIPMMALRASRPERRRRARELLERVGLAARADFAAVKLSGGERQRVAVARALANRPGIVLGDEPTGSLDSKTGQEVVDLLLQLQREEGLTAVLVTHNPEVAKRMRRTVELRDGRVLQDASTDS